MKVKHEYSKNANKCNVANSRGLVRLATLGDLFPLFVLIILMSLSVSGCKKKTYRCGYSYQYVAVKVGLVGFSTSEASDIVINRYGESNGTLTLISSDTINSSNPFQQGDTLYESQISGNPVGFADLQAGVSVQLVFPGLQREFWVTGVSKGAATYEWDQEDRCSMGSMQTRVRSLSNIHLDGNLVDPYQYGTNNYFIFLEK